MEHIPKRISFKDFIATYKPIKNHLLSGAPLQGFLYSRDDFWAIQGRLGEREVWSVKEVAEVNIYNGSVSSYNIVVPGSQPDACGYIVTEVPYPYGAFITVETPDSNE